MILLKFRDIILVRFRRMVFLGLHLAAAFAVFMVLFEPARALLQESDTLVEEKLQLLGRHRSVIEDRTRVDDFKLKIEELNNGKELIPGESDGVINANLQAYVRENAEKAKLRVTRLQALPKKEFQYINASLVGSRIIVNGTTDAILSFIKSLETNQPILLIMGSELSIGPMVWSGGSEMKPAEEIDAQFDIYGGSKVNAVASIQARQM